MDSFSDPTSPSSAIDLPGAAAVTAVTVTYGERRDLLREVLDALPAQGIGKVVVVDNGALWPVKAELTAAYGDWVDVVEMGRNTGSAPGFGAGMQRALDLGAEYLWLLDDDNRPEPGCLSTLLHAYAGLRERHPPDLLAVLAFRPEHQADVAAGVPLRYINPRRNGFYGFHILDIPFKFWRRTPWGRPRTRGTLPALVNLCVAPYSGLLFHRAVVDRFGLPRADFVLYVDDTEITHRLTSSGGLIALVTAAAVRDMESSWNVRQNRGTSFDQLLHHGSDFRVYYATRNRVFFDVFCQNTNNRIALALNRSVFLSILFVLAFLTGAQSRMRLVRQAVHDGERGFLGLNPQFPL